MKRFAILVFALFLTACVAPPVSTTPAEVPEGYAWLGPIHTDLLRYVDKEAGVVCYVTDGAYSGGIDCLPIGDTKLGAQ